MWTKSKFPENRRLYYFSDKIAILDCPICGKPLVVTREHRKDINKELWGIILQECRKFFGKGMRINFKKHYQFADHWHSHITTNNDRYE